ncbi:MAG: hypothetical protein Kow0090_01310 [Myxococcota bacterium]
MGEREQYTLLVAFFVGVVASLLTLHRDFYRTLEHELCHIILAVTLLRKPERLSVRRGNGEAVYSGQGNILIDLAPYFLPLTAFTIALFSLAVKSALLPLFQIGFVAAVGYHLVFASYEVVHSQPDVKNHGILFSLGVVAVIFLLLLSSLSALVFDRIDVFSTAGEAALWGIKRDIYLVYNNLSLFVEQLSRRIIPA